MTTPVTDLAVNIFGRPFQTSLSVLSLIKESGSELGAIWLQFEPVGMKSDEITAICIYDYLKELNQYEIKIWQPTRWLKNNYLTLKDLQNPNHRSAVRYQYAFENSTADFLLLIHSDIFVKKNLIKALREKAGDAFAIGQLGQCWNCPAHHDNITQEVMHCRPCFPDSYENFLPDFHELSELYKLAEKKGIFVRPYHLNNFTDEFKEYPWPLPECRINEWACFINMALAKPNTIPFGPAWPPGAYKNCGKYNLDIGVAWFRDMNNMGFRAKNINLSPLLTHWVGTGSNTPRLYALRELNAFKLLDRHFPRYMEWLRQRYPAEIKKMAGA